MTTCPVITPIWDYGWLAGDDLELPQADSDHELLERYVASSAFHTSFLPSDKDETGIHGPFIADRIAASDFVLFDESALEEYLAALLYWPKSAGKRVPAHVELVAEFATGCLLTVTCSWLNAKTLAPALYGHKATLAIGGSGEKVELLPEKEFAGEIDAETFTKLPAEDVREHEKNWFDCIRSGRHPNADIDLAVRAQVVLSLAEISDRLKTTCLFDETKREVTDGFGRQIAPLTYGNAEDR